MKLKSFFVVAMLAALLIGCGGGDSSPAPYTVLKGAHPYTLRVANERSDGQRIVGSTIEGPMLWESPVATPVSSGALGSYVDVSADGKTLVGTIGVSVETGGISTLRIVVQARKGSKTYAVDLGSDDLRFNSIAVSADGSALLVDADDATTGSRRIARVPIGSAPVLLSGEFAHANGISGDGTTVVGDNRSKASRWVDSGEPEAFLPGDGRGAATAANGDGSVIVGNLGGETSQTDPAYAFRWTAVDGAASLGVLPGWFRSTAVAVSADGEIVVGNCLPKYFLGPSEQDSEPYFWTARTGMIPMRSLIPSKPLWNGVSRVVVTGLSPDGRTAVGIATPNADVVGPNETYGWRLTLPRPVTPRTS